MKAPILKIFITTTDIILLESCSARTASNKMNDMKTFFKKTEKRHKITFKEYADYVGVSLEELEPVRSPSNYQKAS